MGDNVYLNMPFIKKNILEKRKYQIRIAEESFLKNSLVVLPTALGKTYIAVILISKTLRRFPGSKILFLAPTRPLVMQHKESLENVMENVRIAALTGGVPPLKRALRVNNSDIIVSTPQIIKNDLEKGAYTLSDFTLVIFDEAHRARKNYAYTRIASEYMRTAQVPVILGLTASPGKNRDVINELIRTLYIEHVCFRDEYHPDVRDYVFPVDVYIEYVNLPGYIFDVHAVLNDMVSDVIAFFIKRRLLPPKKYYSKVDFLRLMADMKAYASYGEDYEYYWNPSLPHVMADISEKIVPVLFSTAATGIYLLHMDEILTSQTPAMFADYAEELEWRAKVGSAAARRIIKSVRYRHLIRPLLPRLGSILSPKIAKTGQIIKNVLANDPNSRIIVFTQYRETGKILETYLNGMEGISARRFVGQSSRPNDPGMSQKRQVEMISAFKRKEFNVLVATSIAEEGLDIPGVECVIFYEPVPSEIRLIQRRGRTGRRGPGLCYILCAANTIDEIFMNVAFRKEEIMHRVLIDNRDLELLEYISRNPEKFSPTHRSDDEIIDYFSDLAERRKKEAELKIKEISEILENDYEKNRVERLREMGVNDVTALLSRVGLERIKKRAENTAVLKLLKRKKRLR